MDIFSIINGVVGIVTGNNGIIGAVVSGVIIAPFAWRLVSMLWDYFKPIQEFTEFAKNRAYKIGIKQRSFMDKRIKDEGLKQKIINDIDQCQDTLHDEYMRGLRTSM